MPLREIEGIAPDLVFRDAQRGELRFLHVAESPEDIPANREIFRALDLMEA